MKSLRREMLSDRGESQRWFGLGPFSYSAKFCGHGFSVSSTAMFPFPDTSARPLLPSRGSRRCRFPTFIGTMRGVRPLPIPSRTPSGVPYLFREMLLRSTGRRISAVPVAWPVWIGGYHPRLAGGKRSGAIPGSWRIPLKARPGLETPAAPRDLALSVAPMLPSAHTTASASATK